MKLFKHRLWTRVGALLLSLALLITLVGCSEDKTVREGLSVDGEREPFSKATEEYAEGVIYSLLESYYKQTTVQTLPEATVNELRTQSKEIQRLTADKSISEEQYLSIIRVIEANGDACVSEAVRLNGSDTGAAEIGAFKTLYLEISGYAGAEYVGKTLYSLLLYTCDYRYEKSMSRYEKYGYSYLLEEAEAEEEKKELLRDEIGTDSFVSVVKLGCALADLVLGGVLEGGQLESFTDEELLILLKSVRLSSISVSERGWGLLLSYFAELLGGDSYFTELVGLAAENGDLAELAAYMDDVLLLLGAIQSSLTAQDVSLLREGDSFGALAAAFSRFDTSEWQMLEALASIELEQTDYMSAAQARFGEDFTDYCASIDTVSLDELKESLTTNSFKEKLEGYIAGICPAFSYGIIK